MPDCSRAARTAAPTACQMSALSCSAWSGAGWCMAIGCSARASMRPLRSNTPARALPVPTSTAITAWSAIAGCLP